MSILERLESKSIKLENGCWEWHGARDSGNYGHICIDSKSEKAHRVSWTIHNGPIPDGMKVLHSCDNPPCWNPNHLFIGIQQDNITDMQVKGRAPIRFGTNNGRAVLSEKQISEVLVLLKENRLTQAEIGERYRVAQTTISYIKREGWKQLKEQENVDINL